MSSYNGVGIASVTYNSQEVNSWVHNGTEIFSSGKTVTYICDGVTYQEKVKKGQSVLSPTTFSPANTAPGGWTFLGWRSDAAATSGIISSLTCTNDTNGLVLYAVYRKNVTLYYSGNGGSGNNASDTLTAYYNNGNIYTPSFQLRNNWYAAPAHYHFRCWTIAGKGDFSQGQQVGLTNDASIYPSWEINTYAINYVFCGNVISTQYYQAGQCITNYNPGDYGGRSFRGWSDNTGNTSPQTLYADGNKTVYAIGAVTYHLDETFYEQPVTRQWTGVPVGASVVMTWGLEPDDQDDLFLSVYLYGTSLGQVYNNGVWGDCGTHQNGMYRGQHTGVTTSSTIGFNDANWSGYRRLGNFIRIQVNGESLYTG